MTAPHPTSSEGGRSPLATYRFRLQRADVVAFEHLPGELRGLAKLSFIAPAIAGGAVLGFFEDGIQHDVALLRDLPPGYAMLLLTLVVVVPLAYGVSAAVVWLRNRWRTARARLPATETVIATWEDCFGVTEDGATRGYR